MTAQPDVLAAPLVPAADPAQEIPPAVDATPTHAQATEHGSEGRIRVYVWQVPVRVDALGDRRLHRHPQRHRRSTSPTRSSSRRAAP